MSLRAAGDVRPPERRLHLLAYTLLAYPLLAYTLLAYTLLAYTLPPFRRIHQCLAWCRPEPLCCGNRTKAASEAAPAAVRPLGNLAAGRSTGKRPPGPARTRSWTGSPATIAGRQGR